MRGAQQAPNTPEPGFTPEARFRLPHRPGEDGKEINPGDGFFEISIAIAYLIAPACARGEMARTFRPRRDEKNGCDVNWSRSLNRLHGLLCLIKNAGPEKTRTQLQSRSFTGLNWLLAPERYDHLRRKE